MLRKSQVTRELARVPWISALRWGFLLLIKCKKLVVTFKTFPGAGVGAVRPACPRITGLFPVCAEGSASFWEGGRTPPLGRGRAFVSKGEKKKII